VTFQVPHVDWLAISPELALLAAAGMLTAATGAVMHHLWIVLLGGAILLFSIFNWAFEPFEA